MKRMFFAFGLMLIAAVFTFAQKDAKTEAMLIQMDKDWTAAELRGDTKAAGMFVADDFWETNPDGKVWNKTQYLADLKPTKDTDVGDDYVVRFLTKDIAVMTHRGTVRGERDYQYRSTHIWMNRGGKWQIVQHHSGEIMAPAKTAMPAAAAETASPTKGKPSPAKAPAAPSTSVKSD